MFLGNIGSMGIDSKFLRAETSPIWGITYHAYKQVSGIKQTAQSFYTSGPAHQLVRVLTSYVESNSKNALELGQVINQLEDLITTIKLAQAAEYEEVAAFRESLKR